MYPNHAFQRMWHPRRGGFDLSPVPLCRRRWGLQSQIATGGVWVSENLQKLIGVAAMAVLVVVGVAVSSGDDTNFTRNAAFVNLGDFQQLQW